MRIKMYTKIPITQDCEALTKVWVLSLGTQDLQYISPIDLGCFYYLPHVFFGSYE